MSDTKRTQGGQRDTARARGASSRSSGSRSAAASKRSTQAAAKRSVERAAAAQNTRSAGSGTGRKTTSSTRRRRRRQGPDFAKILLVLIGIVILIFCAAVGLKSCSNGESVKETKPVETTAEPETEIKAEIVVNGISVNGMTKSEAREKLLADMDWDLKVSYNEETKPVENLLAGNVDKVLDEAFEKGTAGEYTVAADGIEEAAQAAAAALADGWDVKPKNGSISSYDKASAQFVFSGAQNGTLIEREKLAADMVSAVKAGEYQKTIAATAKTVEPEITEAQAKESFKRIGTYTTTTTSNKARNENIRIASDAINGMIIQPGEEFSFNLTTGNRTREKGYQAAGAYVNGVLVEEPGGGVCQVSSTLYNAVVFAGLKTTERHAHSYEPSYVTPGEDAMVSYDGYSGPDMKFINNSKTAIGIKTSFSNQKLTISVYGSPILEEGVTLSMSSKKVKDLEAPAPVYEEDQTLEPGVEVEAKAATLGSRWVTNLVKKKDGVVVEESLLHNSTYKGKSATIKRNTSGIVIPAEGESTAAEGSSPADGSAPSPSETLPSAEPSTTAPTSAQAPGGVQSDHGVQNVGPSDVIQPSAAAPTESYQGPGNVPQNPADATAPADSQPGGPGQAVPITPSGGPGGAGGPAETNAAPSGVNLISPIG
ncbi:MAG: vanomycin resistance protein VanB [Lachnoclostridium sp.]|nr:vanomycin resistance protein VanB [Lachnoclostridium sp.]